MESDQVVALGCLQDSRQGRGGGPRFENTPPEPVFVDGLTDVVPGRGDLRISLTSACNLKCSYCHNEGQKAPWLNQTKAAATLDDIEELLDVAVGYGVKSVKFSGGDPGIYRGFFGLMDAIAVWRDRYSGIKKWGMATNGTPFLSAKKFQALVRSRLDNISIGIDSVEPGELSKPSSSVGIEGIRLIEEFVRPLVEVWNGRSIKFDCVFSGDKRRALNVVRAARGIGVNVSVIEVNGVMGATHVTRGKFLELIHETAAEFRLQPTLYKPLNEIYLYDEHGGTPIKFYQDHCRDLDCGHCRNIHLRVCPTTEGWGAVPCFLQAQSRTIPLMTNGKLSEARFVDAIRHNGRGPQWFKDTSYDPAR